MKSTVMFTAAAFHLTIPNGLQHVESARADLFPRNHDSTIRGSGFYDGAIQGGTNSGSERSYHGENSERMREIPIVRMAGNLLRGNRRRDDPDNDDGERTLTKRREQKYKLEDFSQQYKEYRRELFKKMLIASYPLMSTSTGIPGFQPRRRLETDCTGRKWHPDTTISVRGCSDSLDNYPPFWDQPEMLGVTMFETSEECCNFFRESTDDEFVCQLNSECDVKGCKDQYFHRILTGEEVCTNDLDYPPGWNNPNYVGIYMFVTGEECCEEFTNMAQFSNCEVRDVCVSISPTNLPSTSPTAYDICKSLRFHPDAESGQGCSNSENYPDDWDLPEKSFLWYDTAEECCAALGGGGFCPVLDVCNSDKPTLPPSKANPISKPTLVQTSLPTTQPTTKPSGSSTLSSTDTNVIDGHGDDDVPCEELKFHPNHVTEVGCSNSRDFPTDWLSLSSFFFFESREDCCLKFGGEECTIEDVCSENLDSPPGTDGSDVYPDTNNNVDTGSCTNAKFHPVSVPGTCSNEDEVPTDWDGMEIFFDSAEECCEIFSLDGKCNVIDICDTDRADEPVDAHACTSQFYPQAPGVCSNGNDIPQDAVEMELFFDSGEECCSVIAVNGKCEIIDACGGDNNAVNSTIPGNGDSCSDRKFHPAVFPGGCSNDGNILEAWVNMDTYFDTAEECCAEFAVNGNCAVTDICSNKIEPEDVSPPTSSPTTTSTISPTTTSTAFTVASPSSLPTLPPTINPTIFQPTVSDEDGPTDDDSCISTQFYPLAPGACINDIDIPQEAIEMGFFFNSGEECCEVFAINGQCDFIDVCNDTSNDGVNGGISDNSISCFNRKFHPALFPGGCSNDGNILEAWVGMKNLYFNTAEECCAVYAMNGNCDVTDICGDDARSEDVPPSTSSPTSPPTSTPSQTVPDCASRKWYPDFTTYSTPKCINGLEYNPSWDLPENEGKFLMDTSEECCTKFFGPSCSILSTCYVEPSPPLPTQKPSSAPTTSTMSCGSRKWHPDFSGSSGPKCTNSLDYSPTWNTPENSANFLLDTKEACCQKFLGKNCAVVDVCDLGQSPSTIPPNKRPTAEPTTLPTASHTAYPTSKPTVQTPICDASELWHVTLDFQKCSNSFDYPSSWLEPGTKDEFMFHSSQDCCLQFFENGCVVEDICSSTSSPTKMPISSPSKNPTSIPTHEPTSVPSNLPTIASTNALSKSPSKGPTFSPTHAATSNQASSSGSSGNATETSGCLNRKWHPKSATDHICSNSLDYPETWNDPDVAPRFLRNSSLDCCNHFYSGMECVVVDVCGSDNFTSITAADCGEKLWHPTSLEERRCTNDDIYPPLWDTLGNQFLRDSAEDCCGAFYVYGDCVIDNICPPPVPSPRDCEGKKWHPKSITERVCSNSDEFPAIWGLPPMSDEFLLNTAEECCFQHYSDGDCEILDICNY